MLRSEIYYTDGDGTGSQSLGDREDTHAHLCYCEHCLHGVAVVHVYEKVDFFLKNRQNLNQFEQKM